MRDAVHAGVFAVDAVAFDLDGTLLDTIHDLAAAVNTLLAELGYSKLPVAVVRDLVGKGMANLLAHALPLAGAAAPGAAEFDAIFARYQQIYAGLLGRHTLPFPGVVDGLLRMRADGYKLAVVTNKASRFVRPHLEAAGIDAFFDAVVGAEDAVRKKPDAAPMFLAAERMGVAASRMLMIGDSANDVAAARAAGCPVLVVPYGYREGLAVQDLAADGIVDSIADVPQRVRRASTP